MDFTMDFTMMILKALASAAFDGSTYIGIAVGALLSHLWIALWELFKASVLLKIPYADLVFKRLESAVKGLLNKAEPVVDVVEDKAAKKKAKVEAKK